jgi:type II secretory pathway component GspD/PulD (secretin)
LLKRSPNSGFPFACLAALVALTLILFHKPVAQAQNDSTKVHIYVVRQSLASAYEALGTLAGLTFQVDPSVEKMISGISLQGTASDVVAQLSHAGSMFYWFDGIKYTIAPITGLPSWTISFAGIDDGEAEKIIRGVASVISPGAIRVDTELKLLRLTGPRELKDAIERGLDNVARIQSDNVTIIKYGQQIR